MSAGFWRGAGLALAISAVCAIALEVGRPLLGGAIALRLSLWLAATMYLASLIAVPGWRQGRLLAAAGWIGLSVLLFVSAAPISLWLLLPTAYIWLLRSLRNYRSLVSAGMDAALSALALAAATLSAWHSHSLFLALWCYFLIQALHHWIASSSPIAGSRSRQDEHFDIAQQHAEAALRRLAPGQ